MGRWKLRATACCCSSSCSRSSSALRNTSPPLRLRRGKPHFQPDSFTLMSMTRSHLTLAALATSALPGLEVTNAAVLPSSSTSYRTALLTLSDGHHILVQAPRNQTAEARQSAEM